ncbi:3D-(3,5/4)-trihydroxycyclohexane-1,2-dione acylhydrolase (decyclizing), partial [Mycobacterium kansasii]
MSTRRMTVGQALIEFLAHQWTVDEVVHADGTVSAVRERTVPATFGIFGHGNVAGVGQALLQYAATDAGLMPYHQARNEQAMV